MRFCLGLNTPNRITLLYLEKIEYCISLMHCNSFRNFYKLSKKSFKKISGLIVVITVCNHKARVLGHKIIIAVISRQSGKGFINFSNSKKALSYMVSSLKILCTYINKYKYFWNACIFHYGGKRKLMLIFLGLRILRISYWATTKNQSPKIICRKFWTSTK